MPTVKQALDFAKDPQTKKLGLSFNGKNVTNGEKVPKADAQSPPTLSIDNPAGPYVVVAIDLDAPFVSFPFLGPILHWVQPGLKAKEGNQLDAAGTPYVAEYGPPGPPPMSAPHKYLFLLYDQPEGFDGKKLGQPDEGKSFPIMKRMRFDFDGFVKKAKLGEIVAASYFESN